MKTYKCKVSISSCGSGTCSSPGCKGWGNIYISYDPPSNFNGAVAATACSMACALPAAINLIRHTLRATQKTFGVVLVKERVFRYEDEIGRAEKIVAHSLNAKNTTNETYLPTCICGWEGSVATWTEAWQQFYAHQTEAYRETIAAIAQPEAVVS